LSFVKLRVLRGFRLASLSKDTAKREGRPLE
jgi:hypothetical protein